MAEIFNVIIKPSGTDIPIPVQRGITKASQAQALKTVYPKSQNPTVNLDKLSIYSQNQGGKTQPSKTARQTKAVSSAEAKTVSVSAQTGPAAGTGQGKAAQPVKEPAQGTGYNSAGSANPVTGGKFSISA